MVRQEKEKMIAEQRLWIAVITLALKDALGIHANNVNETQKAKRWLNLNNKTFVLACALGLLEPEWVLRKYIQAKEKRKANNYKTITLKKDFLTTR